MKVKSKKWIERENLKNWTLSVKERDNYCCQICQRKVAGINCQAHHIIPKQIKEFRYELNNGITLCYQHHKVGKYSPHLNAVWFTLWLSIAKPEQYEWIKDTINEIGIKI